jgi:hypothetical protein
MNLKKLNPWKIAKAVVTGISIALQLHEEHKASGKPIDDFVKDKILNPDREPRIASGDILRKPEVLP